MGIQGMTEAEIQAYASPVVSNTAKELVASVVSKMTVAEFRNKINPMTHYYDNYNIDSFLNDKSINLNKIVDVLLGKTAASLIDENKFQKFIEEIK